MKRDPMLCKACGQPVPFSNAADKLRRVRSMLGLPEQGTMEQIEIRIRALEGSEVEVREAKQHADALLTRYRLDHGRTSSRSGD